VQQVPPSKVITSHHKGLSSAALSETQFIQSKRSCMPCDPTGVCCRVQEFTSVYRMHMLLPERFVMRGLNGSSQEQIWTGDMAFAGARAVMVSVILCSLTQCSIATTHGHCQIMIRSWWHQALMPHDIVTTELGRNMGQTLAIACVGERYNLMGCKG
jgi:hypothetical protein